MPRSSPFTAASNRASSTWREFDCTMTSSMSRSLFVWNFSSRTSWARTDSGLLVKAKSWLRTPPRRGLLTYPRATIATSHRERVRQGWRLLARARISGLSFIASDLLRLYTRGNGLRHMLTPYVDGVSYRTYAVSVNPRGKNES